MFMLHCWFYVIIDFVIMLALVLYFASPRFSLYFLNTNQEIGWEEHPQNYLFCVEGDVKH